MSATREQKGSAVDLLTPPELARRLRLKTSWVYSHADELGVLRLGKYLRFDWDTVVMRVTSTNNGPTGLGPQPNDPEKT